MLANELNIFFSSVASKIADEIHPVLPPNNNVVTEINDNIVQNGIPLLSFVDDPVTPLEIVETLETLQPKTSQDFNGLSMFLVKKLSYQLAKPLCHLFNLSFSQGIVPSQMKIAKISPVHKGGDRSSMDNYRPISLLSCFSKILEKIVCKKLTCFLENNNLISSSQYGFRSGHSTIHPMVQFMNYVSETLNKKQHAVAIFCDLRKAFDTCNHTILFKKMEKMGIRGLTLDWFKNYLTDRKQFVNINGASSNLLNSTIGVPQGSILGPILFLIYINDLPYCSTLLAILFADDTTLLASGDNIEELILHVNMEFKKIVTFFRSNMLSLHPEKTQFILFSNSNVVKGKEIKLNIDMNNENEKNPNLIKEIKRVTSNSDFPAVKFLGVLFYPDLNFKMQIRNISSKISKSLYILRRVKNILSEKALKTLYYSLIHCHLVYGIHIWSSTTVGVLNDIKVKQKNAIRTITLSKYNAHTLPLFKKLKILPLDSLIIFLESNS